MLSGSFAAFVVISNLIERQERKSRLLGSYRLEELNCEECKDCVLILSENNIYQIRKNNKKLGTGSWNIDSYGLVLENGPEYVFPETTKTIPYISTINCREYRHDKNLSAELNGMVLSKKKKSNYTLSDYIILNKNADTIYYQQQVGYPWIEDKLNIGDSVVKAKGEMKFTIFKPSGEKIIIGEK